MIVECSLSLQNGFENRGLIVPYLFKYNYYDCCIKVGIEVIPQKLFVNSNLTSFEIIPTMIMKHIPCLVGVDSIIDVDQFKSEIDIIKPHLDLDSLLFVSSDTCIKYKDTKHYLYDMDSSRILNIFGFMPNIITFNEFIFKYSHPFIDCAGGYFNIDGTDYNKFKTPEVTHSSLALSRINPRQIGNIIGIVNLFEIFKSYNFNNVEILYNYLNENYTNQCQILTNDYLLSYTWLNLDKINQAILRNGVNIICLFGINLIKHMEHFIIILDGKEQKYENIKETINDLKNDIIDYFKINSQISEILFF
tara:strand:+ start:120 stop:1037 length:918 start_codon:yes stop_codon:yes gene_type:complete